MRMKEISEYDFNNLIDALKIQSAEIASLNAEIKALREELGYEISKMEGAWNE